MTEVAEEVQLAEAVVETVPDLIGAVVARHPSRRALVDGPSGRSVDYAELDRRVRVIGAWLQRDGLRAGDRVATWAPNLPPMAAVTLAAMGLGAAVVPLSPALTEPEARGLVEQTGASVMVTVPSMVETAWRLGVRRVISVGDAPGAVGIGELLAQEPVEPSAWGIDVDPDAVAVICASSGTTGPPKGVLLSHRQLLAACRQISRALAADEDDVTLAAAPWFHIMGLTGELLVPLGVGATVVTMPMFERATFVDLLEQHRVTYLVVPPPVVALLADDRVTRGRDLTSLTFLGVGGAPLSPQVQRGVERNLPGCVVGQGWGLTETGGVLCVPRRAEGSAPGTVGSPLPETEVGVVDPATGTWLPPGRDGELVARGPQLMTGYLGRPEETAAMYTPEGWLRTGDLGHVGPTGDVVIVGRLKDLIKVNAQQVAPCEVEEALLAHPGVVDAAVVGRPHPRSGETPVAFVVTDREIDLADLSASVARRLAPYKRPTDIRVVETLPRTPSGKLLRRLLVPAEVDGG